MSGDEVTPDKLPLNAREYFRMVIEDESSTEHDWETVTRHIKMCKSCAKLLGEKIHEEILKSESEVENKR